MKHFSLMLILFIISVSTYSQCSDRFSVALAYYNIKGAGVEVGSWNTPDEPWGHLFGSEFRFVQTQTDKDGVVTTIPPSIIVYYKLQRRLIDNLAINTSFGVEGFERMYAAVALRAHIQLSPHRASIIFVEPTYSTQGFKPTVGFAIAL